MAVEAALAGFLPLDLETHPHGVGGEFLDPGAHDETVAQAEWAQEVHLDGGHVPAEASPDELLPRHPVAARHLVVAGGEHIIHVAAAVHVLEQVDVVRPHLQLGFEFGVDVHHGSETQPRCRRTQNQLFRPTATSRGTATRASHPHEISAPQPSKSRSSSRRSRLVGRPEPFSRASNCCTRWARACSNSSGGV